MGTPKHLLQHVRSGTTWLEHSLNVLGEVTDRLVIVGEGEVPAALSNYERLFDVAGVKGPLAGILAVMRWAPMSRVLVAACDLPLISVEAARWLVASHSPGLLAVMPRLDDHSGVEPLFAYYTPGARPLLEELAHRHDFSPGHLAHHAAVATPVPPPELASAWTNINTQADLESARLIR